MNVSWEDNRMAKLLDEFLEKAYRDRTVLNHVRVVQGGKEIAAFDRIKSCPRDNTWSASKSVVGVAAGFAIDEGLITLGERLCDSFEAYLPQKPQHSLETLTVRDMLTMTTGLAHPLFFADSPERYTTQDWIKYFFEKGDFSVENGARFLYSNFNTYMVSCLIEQKAGQNLLEYLRYRLFEPIGIHSPEWTFCPRMHAHAACRC
jgi:CubicO group peptidase (beta-lactamase class C family)